MRGGRVFCSNFGDKLSQSEILLKRAKAYESEVGLRTWLTQHGMTPLKFVYQPHPYCAQTGEFVPS